MTGVQLIGKNAVLSRFDTFDSDSWALFQGKEFIVGGLGRDNLAGWLEDLERCGSTAAYTLRVYDIEEMPTPSTASSGYIANIRFKVTDSYDGYGIAGHSNKLIGRIEDIEKRLNSPHESEDSDDREPEQSIGNIIMGWLEDPAKLGQIAGAIRTIIDGYKTAKIVELPKEQQPQPAKQVIAGFYPTSREGDVQRLSDAIDKLERRDPKLIEHLEKLAALADKDMALFNAILSKLDAL